jgi:uncharacterized membrane protein
MLQSHAVPGLLASISADPLDWIGLALFLGMLLFYRFFLAFMLKARPGKLSLGKLQAYRHAWLKTHSGDLNSIVVVQTLRNTIMAASFLASTAIILIMGAVNLLTNLDALEKTVGAFPFFTTAGHSMAINLLKVLLIILILSYSFFNFTGYIREVNYMSFIFNIPKDQLDQIEGRDSTQLVSQIFLSSGLHFSMGMRGYYFLIPLFLWIFSPVLMIAATLFILVILMRRDLAKQVT